MIALRYQKRLGTVDWHPDDRDIRGRVRYPSHLGGRDRRVHYVTFPNRPLPKAFSDR
jgi:hypothetical protein